jgi:hypothetical protein
MSAGVKGAARRRVNQRRNCTSPATEAGEPLKVPIYAFAAGRIFASTALSPHARAVGRHQEYALEHLSFDRLLQDQDLRTGDRYLRLHIRSQKQMARPEPPPRRRRGKPFLHQD